MGPIHRRAVPAGPDTDMSPEEALERLLRSYTRYYDVAREGVEPPFAAEAAFHSHDEQYVLVKSARIAESDSHEYVFFATADTLDAAAAAQLEQTAWDRGLARVRPHLDHRSSDVTLIVAAGTITPEAKQKIKKSKHTKSYKHTLHGWSNYRAIALETSSGDLVFNRLGRDLKKLFRNILEQR